MAVQVLGDVPSTEDELDPQYVATAFVEQYYLLIQRSPEMVFKFYNDQSLLDHPGPDGEMTSVVTMQGINDKIMSSDYKSCSFETTNVDAQQSLMGGVLVSVNGHFFGQDNLKKRFYQTFFLAKQAKGYFVLNDILRFAEVLESEALPTSNSTKETASHVPLTHDQQIADIHTQPKEVIDSGEKVSDLDSGKKPLAADKASDGETGKNLSDIKSGEKLSNDINGKEASKDVNSREASDNDSGTKASDIDSSKKEGSDIKDTVAVVPNFSMNESENASSITHVASNEKQKTSYASMVAKESKITSPTNCTGYKIVRVAANADQQTIASATPRDSGSIANSAKKEPTTSNAAAENNSAQADALAAKSIYIANLPSNITKRGLVDALKIFGRVRPGGVQIRSFEDGFCFGFVEFESASAASKAVEVHNVTVGGYEAYMMYKKSVSRSVNNSGGDGRFRNGNSKGQENVEIRVNSSSLDNQADLESQPLESGGQDRETNQKGQSRARRAYSKSKQTSDDRSSAGEAHRKNRQRTEDGEKSGDTHQKNSSSNQQ